MKKFILFIAVAAGLASCAKDPIEVTNEALDGSWDVTSYTINGTEVYGEDGLVQAATYTFAMDEDATGTLKAKVTAFGQENEASSTYVLSGDDGDMIVITDSDGEKTDGTVEIDSDVMTLKYDNSDGNPEVLKASKK